MKILLAILLVFSSAGFLALLEVVPAFFKLTAVPVHADAASVAVHAGAPVDPRWARAAEEARGLARALVATDNLPGLSIAVGMDGRLVWAEGLGWADIAARRPITPDTQFRIGTASAPLTAAGVGLLVSRGELDLDAPVQRYLPEFPQKQAAVSTRQAMAHTAGFRHHRWEEDYMPRRHCDSVREGLELFAEHRLKFTPGTDWAFSTNGWILVSAVAEAASGVPFTEFMAREVFAPLGMYATVPDIAGQPAAEQAAFYYPRAKRDTSYGLEHPDAVDYSCWAGAGVYLSTPSDLVRFGLAMESHALLDEEITALLETPVMLASGMPTEHGLGWFVQAVPLDGEATLRIGHPGIAVGATTTLQRFPEHGIVVAVSSNVTFAELAPFAARVAAIFLAARRSSIGSSVEDTALPEAHGR